MFSPAIEELILVNAIEMQITPIGPNKHLKILALADKLEASNVKVSPEELWTYFSTTFDLNTLEKEALLQAQITQNEITEENMVESGQEDQLPLRSSGRNKTVVTSNTRKKINNKKV